MLSNSANTVCFTMAKLSRSSGLTGSEGGASICNGLIGCPFLYTEIEVRPCRKPCRANVADNLSLLDMAADLYAFGIFAQVHIGSRIYGVMFYFQRMASSAHILWR